ncbi:hypothetical protein PAEH1_01260 [Paenalcaligenes hominis]|uniref:Integrase n=1 Tax=Paenalcaligenes hominis TaxID=643674 RepID=A0A1U9JXN9_9BURK|nr:site-specific integrase [Paenalcaligenes hominis]AQS50511.1 hypothetical protein PAEH1_01260 [Paenalcaligenes hominis]
MATNKLSDRGIKALRPGTKEYEVTDGGGLALRVKKDGSKLWAVRYTSPTTKKRVREYIGLYPDISLLEAREVLQSRKAILSKNIDPANAGALMSSGIKGDVPKTVIELFEAWYEGYVLVHRTNKSSQTAVKSRFNKYVRPQIGDIPLDQVKRGQIMRAIDIARQAGAMRTANLILAEARQMFRYGMAREWILRDPSAAIGRKDAGGQEVEGERVLSEFELVLLKRRLNAAPDSPRAVDGRVLPIHIELAVWWTLATAARAIEVASMQVRHVNEKDRTWTIPSEVSKNTDEHVVHLNDFAMAIWENLKTSGAGYVFPGREEGTHLSGKEVTRRLTDRQSRKPVAGRKNTTELDLADGKWTQHDLRRSAATIMGELGVSPEVIDRCLNHRETKKVTRIYQRQRMMPQRKQAFDLLGEYLTELLGNPKDWLPGARPPR